MNRHHTLELPPVLGYRDARTNRAEKLVADVNNLLAQHEIDQ